MAACSEQEVDGKPSESTLDRTSLSKGKNNDSEQRNVRQNHEILKVNSNEVDKHNKPQDLKNLSDDEFLNLLEEASTFNKPSNQASDLLQQLRNEVAEKDSCGNVDQSESSHDGNPATLVYGRNQKSRNTFPKGSGSRDMEILLTDSLDAGNSKYSTTHKCIDNNTVKKQSGRECRSRESSVIKKINSNLDKTVVQSQSLQDLVNTKLDSLESIRNAGIGRGMRKLQKYQRASSFTSSEVSEHAALLQVSALEPVRTSLKDAKNSVEKFQQNCLPVSNFSSRSEVNLNNAKESYAGNCASLKDCEVLISSPERICNSKVSYTAINKESSCDNVCNKLKHQTSNSNSFNLHNLGEYNESSGISLVSPVELELKEIKVNNSRKETENISKGTVENMYQQRRNDSSESKTSKDNTEVDVPVGFPLNYGHIRSQCNLLSSTIEAVCVDQGLSNITKGITHCENKNTTDDKIQKKKKKNLRQENADENSLQEILPSSSFVRTFDEGKQYCSVDINGNSKHHTAPQVPYSIAAVLPSSTLDCYSSARSFHSENHSSKADLTLRKGKRNRNNIDNQKFIMAEQIAGHRGTQDIDALLEFINSSDSKAKATKANGTNNNSNQIYTSGSKHLINHEMEKRKEKFSVKDKMKTCSNYKKKFNHVSSEDDESQDKLEMEDAELSKDLSISSDSVVKENTSLMSEWNHNNEFLVNTDEKPLLFPLSAETENSLHLVVSASSSPTSSCAADNESSKVIPAIYDPAVYPKFEESEFRVVLKKQRKRNLVYPSRKYDTVRRYSTASGTNYSNGHQYFVNEETNHKEDIMLLRGLPLSHRSQRNKQDSSRRKSTSSVPPSEHSSADNSDLDSVHSLPVSGSVPPPIRTHPHTTPSSTSSTPQASYADIARMSIAPTTKAYYGNLYNTNIPSNGEKSLSNSINPSLESFNSCATFQEKDGNNNSQFSLPNCPQVDVAENIEYLSDHSCFSKTDEESLDLKVNTSALKSDSEDNPQLMKIVNYSNNNNNNNNSDYHILSQIKNKLVDNGNIIRNDSCTEYQNSNLCNSDTVNNSKHSQISAGNLASNMKDYCLISKVKDYNIYTESGKSNSKQKIQNSTVSEVPIDIENNLLQCLDSSTEMQIESANNPKPNNPDKPPNLKPFNSEKFSGFKQVFSEKSNPKPINSEKPLNPNTKPFDSERSSNFRPFNTERLCNPKPFDSEKTSNLRPFSTEKLSNPKPFFNEKLPNRPVSEKSSNLRSADSEKCNPKPVDLENSSNPKSTDSDISVLTEQVCFSGRQNRPPVIILDNYLPSESACGVSFGIDLEELLHLSAGGSMLTHSSHCFSDTAANLSTSSDKSQDCSEGAKSVQHSSSSVVDTVQGIEGYNQQPFDSSSSPSSIVFLSNDDSLIQGQNISSSPASKVLLLKSGQPLHWREVDTDKGSFNFYQIVGFLESTWENLQDCDSGGGDILGNRTTGISFYNDQ